MSATQNWYEIGLDKTPANHQPLTPLSFLERAARVHPERLAVIHGDFRLDYRAFYERTRRLASVLAAKGIGKGDTVSALLLNTPPFLDAHYGVPMTRAILHSLNTRLDAAQIAFQLDHAESKVLIFDSELGGVVAEALELCSVRPALIEFTDTLAEFKASGLETDDYETVLASGDPNFDWHMPDDEWDAISLNYTSGTTGNPKGVVYHHRGAALVSQSNALIGEISRHPVYLWTLPMFHCNGWCFPWTLSLLAGTHVCLRHVRADLIWEAIRENGVTLLCGAPIVLSTIVNADPALRTRSDRAIDVFTAGAPPPAALLKQVAEAGFNVTHVYGLTETYGPSVVNEWKQDWNALNADEQAGLKARQGVPVPALQELLVCDPETLDAVPGDAESMGEIMFRGNSVMKGYLKNPDATAEAFKGGWFHSGDLGVAHRDGYVQLKDRSKDIIISGGENISSVEVEDALFKHPAVLAVAVVAMPDEKWGETPCAFVELKPGADATVEELIAHARATLAHYKCPRQIVFEKLPKTSTGKIQKFELRARAAQLARAAGKQSLTA